MKKINFESATVVKPPQVVVNDVAYDLLPAEVQGGTPVTPDVLNQMQSNVEEVFNGEEAMGSIRVDDIECSNLLNFNDIVPNSTWVYANNTSYNNLSFTMTSNHTDFFPFKVKINNLKENTDYTIKAETDNFNSVFIYADELFGTRIASGNIVNGTTFNTGNNTSVLIGFYCISPVVGTTYTMSNIRLNKGKVALDYTPYKKFGYNDRESMGSILVDGISSKNLFNKYGSLSDSYGWTSGSTTLQPDGTIKATANFANGIGKGQIINVKPNTTYTLSFNIKEMEIPGVCTMRIYGVVDENKTTLVDTNFYGTGYNKITFKTNNSDKLLISFCGIDNVSSVETFKYVIYDEVQLELGDKATPYTPYKEFSFVSGTKDNLYYEKYDNGWIKYYGVMTAPANTNIAVMNLPIPFIDTNYFMTANTKYISETPLPSIRLITTPNTLRTYQVAAYSVYSDSTTPAFAREIMFTAVGRWKGDTSTSTASTMSLRPDTTEEEITASEETPEETTTLEESVEPVSLDENEVI